MQHPVGPITKSGGLVVKAAAPRIRETSPKTRSTAGQGQNEKPALAPASPEHAHACDKQAKRHAAKPVAQSTRVLNSSRHCQRSNMEALRLVKRTKRNQCMSRGLCCFGSVGQIWWTNSLRTHEASCHQTPDRGLTFANWL